MFLKFVGSGVRQGNGRDIPVTTTAPSVLPSTNISRSVAKKSHSRRQAIEINRRFRDPVVGAAWRTRGFGPCSKTCAGGTLTYHTIMMCYPNIPALIIKRKANNL